MKAFFAKYKVPLIIVLVVVLLAAIWTPIIVILSKNSANKDVVSSAVSEVDDVTSEVTSEATEQTDIEVTEEESKVTSSKVSKPTGSEDESVVVSSKPQDTVTSKSESLITSSTVSATSDNESEISGSSSENSNFAVSSRVSSKKPQKNELPELEGGAEVNESCLANTYKLLTFQKKLTIGYFGGSITGGSSAKKIIRNGGVFSEEGSMMDSYVNRVSSWFKEKFPEAEIETVNSGVSDTHSQFGVYRLESTLMNTKGHDKPDLVFVEFTTNDWIYGNHTKEVVKSEIESIIINIRKINPYADIVILSTNVAGKSNNIVIAHREVADHYGLPFIDVGEALQKKKTDRGAPSESAGTFYYTTDNLHPSADGFLVYLKTITPVLKEHLDGLKLESNKLYNYNDNAPSPLSSDLITPNIIQANEFTILDKAALKPYPLTVSVYGTSVDKAKTTSIVDWYISVENGGSIKADFVGNSLGLFISMSKNNVELEYSIDDGEWETFAVNNNVLSHQRYAHLQAFMLKGNLSDGNHTVTIRNKSNKTVNIGGVLAEK